MIGPGRSFRLVCAPDETAAVESLLAAEGYAWESEPFFPLARRLTAEPTSLGESLAARFGLLYILDRSSMLPPLRRMRASTRAVSSAGEKGLVT